MGLVNETKIHSLGHFDYEQRYTSINISNYIDRLTSPKVTTNDFQGPITI